MLHKLKTNKVYYSPHWQIKDLVVVKNIFRYLPAYRTVNYTVNYIKNGMIITKVLHDDWLELTDEI